jgi:hypothetical protein
VQKEFGFFRRSLHFGNGYLRRSDRNSPKFRCLYTQPKEQVLKFNMEKINKTQNQSKGFETIGNKTNIGFASDFK